MTALMPAYGAFDLMFVATATGTYTWIFFKFVEARRDPNQTPLSQKGDNLLKVFLTSRFVNLLLNWLHYFDVHFLSDLKKGLQWIFRFQELGFNNKCVLSIFFVGKYSLNHRFVVSLLLVLSFTVLVIIPHLYFMIHKGRIELLIALIFQQVGVSYIVHIFL